MIRVPTHRQPTHPGEMLLEEFLKPMNISQRELSEAINVSYQRINEIINGRRGITPSTALRLSKYFGVSPDFWMNIQLRLDIYNAQKSELKELNTIKPRLVGNGRDRSVVKLNQCGLIVEQQWKWLFQQYKYIKSDEYIVMPDHFHGILFIDPVGIRYNRDRSLRGAFFILTSPCHYVNADIVYKFSNPPKGQGCLTLK